MEDVQSLLTTAVGEIERILSSKTVVGEPITVGETTLIPLVSVGFGFGAGGGTGPTPGQPTQGSGGGTGGGGGIKPVAVVVIDSRGVRLEPIKSGTANLMEKMADAIGKGMQRARESKGAGG